MQLIIYQAQEFLWPSCLTAEFIESAPAPHFFTLLLSFALPLPAQFGEMEERKGD